MKLADLEPIWLDKRGHGGHLGVVFSCPGACCAAARARQARAAELEAAGEPGAAAARHEAFVGQPFRVKAVFIGAPLPAAEVYAYKGDTFATLTIEGLVDRTADGHALMSVNAGDVEVA